MDEKAFEVFIGGLLVFAIPGMILSGLAGLGIGLLMLGVFKALGLCLIMGVGGFTIGAAISLWIACQ